jgi:hypothetical protein
MIVACLQRVSFFLEAETIEAAPILDYGELTNHLKPKYIAFLVHIFGRMRKLF